MNFGFIYIFIFSVVELPFPCKNVFGVVVGRRSACVNHRNIISFKDVCKSDIGAIAMDIEKREDVANDRSRRKRDLHRGLVREEKKRCFATCVKIARRNENNTAKPWGGGFISLGCN